MGPDRLAFLESSASELLAFDEFDEWIEASQVSFCFLVFFFSSFPLSHLTPHFLPLLLLFLLPFLLALLPSSPSFVGVRAEPRGLTQGS